MKKRLLVAILTLFVGLCGFAQEKMTEDERKKVLKQARAYFQMEEFTDAFKLYSILHEDDTNDARVNFELGMTTYEGSFNKLAAKKYLEKAERDGNREDMPELFYYMGRVYHLEHDFLFATASYSTYMAEALPPGKQGKLREKEVQAYIQQCEEGKDLMEESEDILASVETNEKNIHKYYLEDGSFVKIENLGEEVNSAFSEYGPIIMEKGETLLFTSRREASTGGLLYTDGEYFEDIYVAKKKFGIFTEVQNINNMDVFDNVIRNSEKHDATVSISSDEKELYVYKDNQIEHVNFNGENWVQPAKFSKEFSRTGSQVTSAAISPDGSYMILSATRFDCIGGRDLYISENIGEDDWGELKNIGPELNTIQDEDSPFMLNDTTLYFSSKGHSSIGGYDIFVSYLRGEKWSTPENLKIPINSPYDEITYLGGHDGSHAFVASNRQGGFGAFDLYMITEGSEEEIDDEMLANMGKKVASVLIIDSIVLLENGSIDSTYRAELDEKVALMQANDGITAEIYGAALPGEDKDMARKRALKAYNYMVNQGISEDRLTANYPGKDAIDGKEKTEDAGGPFVAKYEQTIHFGTNSKLVTEYSRGKLVAFLDYMKDKPDAKVYLSGHSDHVGNEKYNLELSKKRTDSVEEYLRSQGIKQDIRKEYFGESTPRFSQEEVQNDPNKLILNRRVNIVVF